jgi:hypothetical protein
MSRDVLATGVPADSGRAQKRAAKLMSNDSFRGSRCVRSRVVPTLLLAQATASLGALTTREASTRGSVHVNATSHMSCKLSDLHHRPAA